MCHTHGIEYSPENCKDCDYEVKIKLIKELLKSSGPCQYCKNDYIINNICGNYHACDKQECEKYSLLDVAWEKVYKEFLV